MLGDIFLKILISLGKGLGLNFEVGNELLFKLIMQTVPPIWRITPWNSYGVLKMARRGVNLLISCVEKVSEDY